MPVIKVKLKALTPVHVGNGQKLREGLDFVLEDRTVHVLGMTRLLDRFRENPEVLDRFSASNFNLGRLLSEFRVGADQVAQYSLAAADLPVTEVWQSIRTALGAPIIPGSSLKGALRTCILWNLTHEEQNSDDRETEYVLTEKARSLLQNTLTDARNRGGRLKFPAGGVEEGHLGGDITAPNGKRIRGPNNSLLRALQLPDFQFSAEDMILAPIKVSSEEGGNGGIRWKKFGSQPNVPDPGQAVSIHVEAIRAGSEAMGKIKIDDFLIEKASGTGRYSPGRKGLEILASGASLFKAVNIRSFELMGMECDYLDEINDRYLFQARDFLAEQMERIHDKPSSFCIFPLGWGAGWRGMTGPLLSDGDLLGQFRRVFGKMRGREGFGFPKTRKLCLSESGRPELPPGWVELSVDQTAR